MPSPLSTDLSGRWAVSYEGITEVETVHAGLPNLAPTLTLVQTGDELSGQVVFPTGSTGGALAGKSVAVEGDLIGNSYLLASVDSSLGLEIGGYFHSHLTIGMTLRAVQGDAYRERLVVTARRLTPVPPDRPLSEYLGSWELEVTSTERGPSVSVGQTVAVRFVTPTSQYPDAVLLFEWPSGTIPIRVVRDNLLIEDDPAFHEFRSTFDFVAAPPIAYLYAPKVGTTDPPFAEGSLRRSGSTP